MLVLVLMPFFYVPINSINLYICWTSTMRHPIRCIAVTEIKEEVCVLCILMFYSGERQVNQKMLSPVFEKHNLKTQKVVPGLSLEGGTRLNHLYNWPFRKLSYQYTFFLAIWSESIFKVSFIHLHRYSTSHGPLLAAWKWHEEWKCRITFHQSLMDLS